LLPNGVFIPILWETLPKKGNSNTKERISLLTRLQIIQEKVQIMMGIAAITYCISIKEGLRLDILKPTKIKKHESKAVSYFRLGFDNLQNTVHQLIDLIQFILKILKPLKLLDCDLKSV
jgi:hypothetical protein